MSSDAANDLVRRLEQAGFDALAVFDAREFNRTANGEPFRLPVFGRETVLSLVIGNSRALWPRFMRALDEDAGLRAAPHPLDRYSEARVSELQTAVGVRSKAFFAHQGTPRVPIQRIAQVAGLAELSPSHLSVHRVHGPWLGLRAVVVFDLNFVESIRAEPAWASLVSPAVSHHCRGCAAPCMPALEQAVADQAPADGGPGWRAWLAVRDACPAAPERRYGPHQIRYHYTKDKRALLPEPA